MYEILATVTVSGQRSARKISYSWGGAPVDPITVNRFDLLPNRTELFCLSSAWAPPKACVDLDVSRGRVARGLGPIFVVTDIRNTLATQTRS